MSFAIGRSFPAFLVGIAFASAGCAGDDGSDDGSTAADTAGTAGDGNDESADDDGTDATPNDDTGGDTAAEDTAAEDTAGDTAGDDTTAGEDSTGSDDTAGDDTAGDGTAGESTGAAAVSYADEIFPMFLASGCTECHAGGNPAASLALEDAAQSYADMVDVASVAGQCPTQDLRVSPGSLEDSCLDVFFGNFLANGSMTQAEVDLGRQWILEGAAP